MFKRNIKSLPTWKSVEQKFMENPKFREAARRHEPEFQVQRTLVKLQIDNKFTQRQLADRLGVKQTLITRVQNGTISPSLDILQRIADAVGARLIVKFAY